VTRVGVLVHGGDDELGAALVGAITRAEDLGEVRAVEVVGTTEVVGPACARLAEVATSVIGLGVAPWPGWSVRHAAAHDALGDVPYWAVETWHGLPALHRHLVDAVGGRWQDGSRVLLTAPDEAVRRLPPEERVVLRDVAEALHAATGARPVIAVDRSPDDGAVTPTAVTTVTTLAEAHGAERVVRVSLAPGDGPDPAVAAAAFAAGIQLSDVTLHRDDHVQLLLAVVRTMLGQAIPSGTDEA
jgi:hypothetical protein